MQMEIRRRSRITKEYHYEVQLYVAVSPAAHAAHAADAALAVVGCPTQLN